MILNDFVTKASHSIFEHETPLKYIRTRGLSDDDIRRFLIGYLRVAKIRKEESEDYRALSERTYGFKSLQNKIIFPLRNILGNVHGLCTRDIEHKRYTQYFLEEAKNIGTFFGIYEALPYIRKTRKVFVHEGAFDAMSFARVFPNSISSLTSFLNEQQYELLRFYADKIILVYDRDSAGSSGIRKSFEYYGEKYLDRIYLGADDSNSYLQRLGSVRFEQYVRSKVPILLQN